MKKIGAGGGKYLPLTGDGDRRFGGGTKVPSEWITHTAVANDAVPETHETAGRRRSFPNSSG